MHLIIELLYILDLGLQLENGLYVTRVNQTSYVAKDGLITGDRIISVSINSNLLTKYSYFNKLKDTLCPTSDVTVFCK
mgnify:FL=1